MTDIIVQNISESEYSAILRQAVAVIDNTKAAVAKSVCAAVGSAHWELGKLLYDRKLDSIHGSSVVRRLSADLKERFPQMGMSPRNLWYMRRFYERFCNSDPKVQQPVALLPWGHTLQLKHISLLLLILLISISANAQTEVGEQASLSKGNELSKLNWEQSLPTDSLPMNKRISNPQFIYTDIAEPYRFIPYNNIIPVSNLPFEVEAPKAQLFQDRLLDLSMPSFHLWRGANLSFMGNINQNVGLMDAASGSMAYNQNLGNFHISVSANANKYWMPMQKQLVTQYGIGGTLSYQLNNDISFHAYGYYYNSNPIVGPAYCPYVNTSSYGGYANIRFSDRFSTDVGVNRYVNPMTGRWTTSPIVTPHLRVGRVDIGLPVGEFLKAAFGGDKDDPMRYREPQKRQSKKRK